LSDGGRNKEIDPGIGRANGIMREVYRPVLTKREL